MLVQVCFLCEKGATTLVAAGVGTLFGVYSNVVKEIVPFLENLVATFEGAVEQSDARRVLMSLQIFEYPEFINLRHVRLDSYSAEVKVFAEHKVYVFL